MPSTLYMKCGNVQNLTTSSKQYFVVVMSEQLLIEEIFLQLAQPSNDKTGYYKEWVKDLFNYKRYSNALNNYLIIMYSFRPESSSLLSHKYQPSKNEKR